MNKQAIGILAIVLSFIFFESCTTFGKKVGGGLGDGVSQSLADTSNQAAINQMVETLLRESMLEINELLPEMAVDTIGYNVGEGLRQNLLDPVFADSLTLLVTNLLVTSLEDAGVTANQQIQLIGDNLLKQLAQIDLTPQVRALREELLGAKTTEALSQLVQTTLKEAIQSIDLTDLRKQLLGLETNLAIRAIVDSSMVAITQRLNKDVLGSPQLDERLDFIQANAKKLLAFLVAISLAIIAFVWYERRKYLKMATVLSAEIFKMPDQQSYDELTTRIKSTAIAAGVEPQLRKVLKDNGILGEQEWQSYVGKKQVSS